MTHERWKQIEALYHSALAREGSERVSYLEEVCAGDDELRREVGSLLSNAGQSEDFLESQALEAAAQRYVSVALPDLSGKRLGRYEVMARLGEGGMGEVYRARDTRLKRDVALKVLRPESLADPDRKRRFEREARAASALDHPNIVTIYDIDQAEGVDFIAMEYLPGKALKYAVQIAGALAAAHGAGIVHRDLKPANIMVGDSGQVKVLDFGLAKLTERAGGEEGATESAPVGTVTGTILGTIAYMSPEQAEAKKVDARSDIFSFGAVVYEMLTGHRAFARDSAASTLAAILKEEPKPLAEIALNLPPDLEKILVRCLRKNPERRFQHIDDVKVALEEVKSEGESGAPTVESSPVRQRRPVIVSVAVILAVAVIASVAVFFSRRQAPSPMVAVPLTTDAGFKGHPGFSPDGNQVVYHWSGPNQDNADLYVKLIGSESVLRLTLDPASDVFPAWSPDGRWIAFERHASSGKVGVYVVAAIGGSERRLAEISACSGGVSWHPDGKWLAVADASGPETPCSLYALSVDTGEKRRLTYAPPGQADGEPALSPDGRRLAFCRILGWNVVAELFVVGLDDDLTPRGEPKQFTFKNQMSQNPAWSPEGREIVFESLKLGGEPELWRMPASGASPPQRLMFVGSQGNAPAISRQGHRMAYVRNWTDQDIWRLELPRSNGKAGGVVKLIFSTAQDGSPHYSPDGKTIVFTSARSGSLELWVCAAGGSNVRKLTSVGAAMTGAPRWSPDGQRIVFDSTLHGNFDVYVVDAHGGKPQRLTEGPSSDAVASWSRDGRHIYFVSDRTGRMEIWKMPARGGKAVQVTRNGGYVAFESPDGKTLYYSKFLYNTSLWRTPVGGGEEQRVLESVLGFQFVVMEERVYFERQEPDGGVSLSSLTLATGEVKRIRTIERPGVFGLSVSPDEQYILYPQSSQDASDLMLVENFR